MKNKIKASKDCADMQAMNHHDSFGKYVTLITWSPVKIRKHSLWT